MMQSYKVLIRPLQIEDASISYSWRNDPEIWKYTGKRPDNFITKEIEKKWLSEKLLEENSARFAIIVNDEYVGNIQLTGIVPGETAEYHIFIGDKNYWGKGIGYLATCQILRFAKEILNLKEIRLFVNPNNKSAIKLYEKSGFKRISDQIEMNLLLKEMPSPILSVFMMVYNHEEYIAESIEGVLMQRTNFDFEIVVGEDCSTDKSRSILLEYQRKYPGKFKLLLHEKNIGAMANQMAVFKECTGKYIAMCEGDDYWTDPLKLQKQVDFMEVNSEYIACFTNAIFNDEIHKTTRNYIQGFNEGCISQSDIIKIGGGLYPTASLVFIKEKINWQVFTNIKELAGDELLIISLSMAGKIYFQNIITCVYRRWEGGVYSSISTNLDKLVQYKIRSIIGLKKLLMYTTGPGRSYLKKRISSESLFILLNGPKISNIMYVLNLTYKDFIRFVFKISKL